MEMRRWSFSGGDLEFFLLNSYQANSSQSVGYGPPKTLMWQSVEFDKNKNKIKNLNLKLSIVPPHEK